MEQLTSQLGIDSKLLIAQGVNFVILLIVLTQFVYKPLMKMVEERRKKIELGIKGGEMAKEVILDAEKRAGEKIQDADSQAVSIISYAEKNASVRAQEIINQADKKAQDALREAMLIAERKEKEEMARVSEEAKKLVRDAIIRTVEMKPEQIDDKLIEQAVKVLKV